jgi:chromate transporter
MRNSIPLSTFLDAVNVASVALIIAICFQMSYAVIADWRTILIALISFTVA